MSGAPGVGKTSLGYFLCNEILPTARTSTACIEQAKRFIIENVGGKGQRCRQISLTDMVEMIAENLSAGISIAEEEPSISLVQVGSEHIGQPESSRDEREAKTQQLPKEERVAAREKQGAGVPAYQHIATQLAVSRAEVLPRTAEIVKKMSKLKETKEVLKAHFLLFVDCGGQPQFMDMIPILMKNAFLRLHLFKLSDKLGDRPAVDYYAPSGVNYSLGHFMLTNEELIMRCMQMTECQHSQLPMLFIEKQPKHPKSMVIGTFKDKLHTSGESLEDKNCRLASLLQNFNKCLIKRSENEVIYAVNNAGSGLGVTQDPMAKELLQIMESCGQSMQLKYPLGYYLFEVELRRMGKIVSKAECWAIAQQLMFESEDAMEAALQFFHAVNLMFYFPAVVKDVVFVEPMALLDWITNVFEASIEAVDAPESDIQSEEMMRLRNQALVTSTFLQSLQSKSICGDVKVNTLINVLEHLLIIAPVQVESDTKYFMPSLLDSRDSSEIVRPRCDGAATLRIKFSSSHVPSGVLCCLIVYMRSPQGMLQWQIPLHHSEEPTQLYKNELHFKLDDFGGGITLIDDDIYYSVYVDSDCSSELLPLIWNDISQGISDVCSKLSLDVTHTMGFDCLCGKSFPHLAVVSPDHKSWMCSEDLTVTDALTYKQRQWLPAQANLESGLRLTHVCIYMQCNTACILQHWDIKIAMYVAITLNWSVYW